MEADGAPFAPSPRECSVLRLFKAKATQIRGKLEQTLESLRIKLGTSSTEGNALTNCLCYTSAPLKRICKFLYTASMPRETSSTKTFCVSSRKHFQVTSEFQSLRFRVVSMYSACLL